MMNKTYSELSKLQTFEERFNYLKLSGKAGEITFGNDRLINQNLYQRNPKWKLARSKVIIRDNGCDLGIEGRDIYGPVMVHHINPITVDDILNQSSRLYDPENLICVSRLTHNAIHYSDDSIIVKDPIERKKNDTCPWKK